MRVLVKLGGTLLEHAESRAALATQLTAVAREHSLVVVHGGGKQVTKYLEERGVRSSFLNGLRVSDEAVIDAVTKVIAGTVNHQLVSSLIAAGLHAVGLSGSDGPLTIAEQFDPALGYVGRPIRTDGRLLELLVEAGYVPTVACVAADEQGRMLNVNADQMAVSCATGWRAWHAAVSYRCFGREGRQRRGYIPVNHRAEQCAGSIRHCTRRHASKTRSGRSGD